MKPKVPTPTTMPVTVCSQCGGRFDDPAGYISHLSTCNPVRLQQLTRALRGLRDAPSQNSLEVSR